MHTYNVVKTSTTPKREEVPHVSNVQTKGESKEIIKAAHNELTKEDIKEEEKNTHKFEELVDKSQRVLLKITSIFPFDFFPDEITVEESKVNIIIRIFFFSEQIHSIPIKYIQDAIVETNLLFATLKLVVSGFPGANEPVTVKYLSKGKAAQARRLIHGLMVINQEGVDLSKVRADDFKEKIEQVGRAKFVEE